MKWEGQRTARAAARGMQEHPMDTGLVSQVPSQRDIHGGGRELQGLRQWLAFWGLPEWDWVTRVRHSPGMSPP